MSLRKVHKGLRLRLGTSDYFLEVEIMLWPMRRWEITYRKHDPSSWITDDFRRHNCVRELACDLHKLTVDVRFHDHRLLETS